MGEVGIIDIFGVFAGLLGTISFVKSNLPAQPQSGGSVLRVAIGSHSEFVDGYIVYRTFFDIVQVTFLLRVAIPRA